MSPTRRSSIFWCLGSVRMRNRRSATASRTRAAAASGSTASGPNPSSKSVALGSLGRVRQPDLLRQVGAHPAGAEHRDADAPGQGIGGERLRESHHREFRGAVARAMRPPPDQPADRGGVDDVTRAAGQHGRQEGAHPAHHPQEVDVQDPQPVRDRHLLDRSAEHHAGVVHQDVRRAEHGRRRRDQRLDVGVAGDVAAHRQGTAPARLDLSPDLGQAGVVDVGQHDRRALGGEGQGRGPTDAAGRAGDDSGLAFEAPAHGCAFAWGRGSTPLRSGIARRTLMRQPAAVFVNSSS